MLLDPLQDLGGRRVLDLEHLRPDQIGVLLVASHDEDAFRKSIELQWDRSDLQSRRLRKNPERHVALLERGQHATDPQVDLLVRELPDVPLERALARRELCRKRLFSVEMIDAL